MNSKEAQKIVGDLLGELRDRRLEMRLSQRKLASLAGVDPKTIRLLEAKERNPTLVTLLMIAEELSLDLPETLATIISA